MVLLAADPTDKFAERNASFASFDRNQIIVAFIELAVLQYTARPQIRCFCAVIKPAICQFYRSVKTMRTLFKYRIHYFEVDSSINDTVQPIECAPINKAIHRPEKPANFIGFWDAPSFLHRGNGYVSKENAINQLQFTTRKDILGQTAFLREERRRSSKDISQSVISIFAEAGV